MIRFFALLWILGLLISCKAVDLTGKCVAGPTTGLVNATSVLAKYSQYQAFLSAACTDAAVPYLCARSFQPCIEVNYTDSLGNNQTIGVPARPCKQLCQRTYDACDAILATAGLSYLVNCNDTDEDGELYPNGTTTYDLTPLGLTPMDVDCNNGSQNLNSSVNVTCADPLFTPIVPGVVPYSRFKINEIIWEAVPQYRNHCAVKCPNPQYSEGFWHSISAMFFSISLISLLLGCFTVVTFVFYPERRKWPSILILHITVASMIAAFAGTATLWKGDVDKFLCESKTQWERWRVPSLCSFQAIIFTLGTHGILWWWCTIALNTAAIVVFRMQTKKYYWAMVVVGWVPPFVFAFVVIGIKDAKAGVGWPFCAPSKDGLLYYPIGVLGSLGFLATASIVGWIIYVTLRGNSEAKFFKTVQRCTRPLLFGLIISIPFAIAFIFRWTTNTEKQIKQLQPYIQCIISGPYQLCGKIPRISPTLTFWLSFSLSCEGIIVWAVYSTRVKYFTDPVNWLRNRPTAATTVSTSGGSSRQATAPAESGSAAPEFGPSRF